MRATTFASVIVLALAIVPSAMADQVAVADLVVDSAAYDAAAVGEITIEGELVGDFQRRGAFVWVQVNGDVYADRALLDGGSHGGSNVGIGARFPTVLFDSLEAGTPGGYRVRGAIVTLTGEWHHHDEARGGESWFEVTGATVLSPERHLGEPMSWPVMVSGLLLLLLAGGVAAGTRRRLGG